MKNEQFDKYANEYDSWFLKNKNLLYSEVKLVAHFLRDNPGEIFSVGCGSGLFETILDKEFGISIKNGIEPSVGMAEIARKRGVNVEVVAAEEADFGVEKYDTILFNGTPSYITDLQLAFDKAFKALRKGGRIIAIDVPKESSYAIMYNLAMTLGRWDHPLLQGVHPQDPYPIEFLGVANWRTTAEKVAMLECAGFEGLEFAQTLTKHPVFSDRVLEEPIEGSDSGDYVAVCAYKK